MVLNGRERGRVVRLLDGPAAVVGQRQDADVPLGDPWISWEHARIVREGPGFAIEDLSSTNGTYVNTARVERAALRHDDVIFLGRTHVLFCEGDPPAGAGAIALPPPPTRAATASAFAEAERSLEEMPEAEQTMRLKLDQAQGLFAGPLVGIDDDAVLEVDTDEGTVGPDLLESLEIVEAAPAASAAAAAPGGKGEVDDGAGAPESAKDGEIARLRAALAGREEEVRRLLAEIQSLKEKYLDL